ncbi:MAG TPA: hypothetical protein VFY70_05260 [Thermomicrobiales bacterium]|jgi:hypothetical protein|nr:hypothetical protein [Thermomicrobiales bacterium]
MSERDPLSMSTDNTVDGEMYSDTVEGGPISNVMIGDTVVDSTGKEVGTVKFVKMGDPNAATDEGQEDIDPGFFGIGGDSYDLGSLPEQARHQLMRVGFIHIDVSLADDRFAGAGQIARVENNTVYLSVPEANLI